MPERADRHEQSHAEDDERGAQGDAQRRAGSGGQRGLVDGHQHGGADGRADPLAGLEGATRRAAHPRRDVREGEGDVGRDDGAAAEPGEEHQRCGHPGQTARVVTRDEERHEAYPGHRHGQRDHGQPPPEPRHDAPGERGGDRRPEGERHEEEPGLKRRIPESGLQVDREHEQDAGVAGEVRGADEQTVRVAGQTAQQADVEEGRPARLTEPPLPRTNAHAKTGTPTRTRSVHRCPPSTLTTG